MKVTALTMFFIGIIIIIISIVLFYIKGYRDIWLDLKTTRKQEKEDTKNIARDIYSEIEKGNEGIAYNNYRTERAERFKPFNFKTDIAKDDTALLVIKNKEESIPCDTEETEFLVDDKTEPLRV